MEDDVKFILSIDGGGFRGIIPAEILSQIEKRVTEQISKELGENVDIRIADLFDMISGTSTGSILTLGLTVPNENDRPKFSAEFLVKFYEDNGHNVFSNFSALMLKHFIENESKQIKQITNKQVEEASMLGKFVKFGSNTLKSISRRSLKKKKNQNEQIDDVKIEDLTKDKNGNTIKSTVEIYDTEIVTTSETENTKENLFDNILTSLMGYSSDIQYPFKPKYDGKELEVLLRTHFGDAKLIDTVNDVKIVVPSYDISDGEGVIFTNFENKYDDYFMRDVIRASAAAPTYFPAKQIGKQYFIDGGVFLNNPTALAYLKAKKQFPNSKFVVISLGAGNYKQPLQKYANEGVLQWGIPLIGLLFDVDLDNNDAAMRLMAELDNTKYFRLQKLADKNLALDTVSDKEITTLVTMANDVMSDPENNFDEIINILVDKYKKKKNSPQK
ncbi:acyl transferase/acyl hydrolase/lysophospholipase [Gigaspora rosea]|uniref:Acyl transferase/acyl hydrolase/lysophospholipase n=1 Tax=Gigaspora rosea TaxID=44941 RepID=A0A397W793_9GLOM|nr:acyl transferase/acyl hydrolase/lysophospholipase [Gigaspora rosea]